MDARALAALATEHGLTLLADELRTSPYLQSLRGAPNGPAPSPPPLLAAAAAIPLRMIRRGAEPSLVADLLESLAGRPIEQGLAAWDVLCTSLITDRAKHALHETLRPVRSVLPLAGTQGLAFEALPVLGPNLHALEAISDEDLLRQALAFHYAGLDTLASLYFLHAYGSRAEDGGLIGLCEVLLEQRSPERLPAGLADRLDPEWLGYVLARTATIRGERWPTTDCYAMRDEQAARSQPRLRIAEAEVGMNEGQLPFMYQVVDLIADKELDWRYAARVRVTMHLWSGESDAPSLIESFLACFGHYAPLWRVPQNRVTFGDKTWRELTTRAMREAYSCPWDAAAWSGLITLACADAAPAQAQLAARLRAQCPSDVVIG
jgi:hypothetical protein